LDRFAHGLPDPQERPPALVGYCAQCQEPIYFGDRVVLNDDLYFCDTYCFMQATNTRWVYAGIDEPAPAWW